MNYAQDYLSETSDVEQEEKAEKREKQKIKEKQAEERQIQAEKEGSLIQRVIKISHATVIKIF